MANNGEWSLNIWSTAMSGGAMPSVSVHDVRPSRNSVEFRFIV